MGLSLKKRALFLFCFVTSFLTSWEDSSSALSHAPPSIKSRILYLVHHDELSHAFQEYEKYRAEMQNDDYELIEELALSLLDLGSRSKDEESQLLTLFGAGISTSEKALPILINGLQSNNEKIQLIALSFLAKLSHDVADEAILKSFSSPFPMTRLEASYILAKKKHIKSTSMAESLMHKLPDEAKPLFAIIFAEDATVNAIKNLKKLMSDPKSDVRVASILSAAEAKLDELLPKIRCLVSQHNFAEQEASCYALGLFKDEKSVDKLLKLANSEFPAVHLAAWYALYSLGRFEFGKLIQEKARYGDLFAIALLGKISQTDDLLYQLTKSEDKQIRINAALSLLQKKDPRVCESLSEILLKDSKDFGFHKIASHGRSLTAWKVIPSSAGHFSDNPINHEISLSLREEVLQEVFEMNEEHYLPLAKMLFDSSQNDLIPTLIQLLENIGSKGVIELLKEQLTKVGSPLIRTYSILALARLKEVGPYNQMLLSWILSQKDIELIRFRAFVGMDFNEKETSKYELTPQETSRLYIEAIETLVMNRDRQGIEMLLNIIENGNQKNRYALSGLLLRAIQ